MCHAHHLKLFLSLLWLINFCLQCRLVQGTDVSPYVEQTSPCSARVNGQLINMQPLDKPGIRYTSQYTTLGKTWNYTFNPCTEFNLPSNPNEGFGDKCLAVSVCKYGEDSKRQYFYTLGFQPNGKFLATVNKNNKTEMALVFEGYRSMKGKLTHIHLVCDKTRIHWKDALFQVKQDGQRLGDVVAELHHVCCCPGGCPVTNRTQSEHIYYPGKRQNYTNVQTGEVPKESKISPDRTKVLIIVGVNIGVILMAGVVGLMCYNKKSHLEIYHKLPGVRSVPEPTLWQLANSTDLVEGGNSNGIISAASQHNHSIHGRDEYRDGAPYVKRKSLSFPVLEHSGLPEECISIGQRMGGGIFGDTYKGEWTGIQVAVKRITLSVHKYQLSEEFIHNLQKEITFLSKQRHRNIVSVLGYCTESKHPYIISEFMQGQVMKDFIQQASQNIMWPHRVKILSQVADAMAFLHSTDPPLLHRDLRCGNMFLTNNDVVKVCDFGIVKLTQTLRADCQQEDCACQGLYSACPPLIGWTAPEVLEHPNSIESDGHITRASDVYSYGVVMWELISGNDPYEDMHTAGEVIDHVLSGGRPPVGMYSKILPVYTDLMKSCWDANPDERPNFKQISVRLKEIHHQAKLFQKALNSKGARPKTRTISFSDESKGSNSKRNTDQAKEEIKSVTV